MGSFTRINQKIRVPTVKVIGPNREVLGIMPTRDALYLAQKQNLDLVEMGPNDDPPLCKIMDYGKFRYDEGMKRKAARKQQKKQVLKEIKLRPNVDKHDLEVKVRQLRSFIAEGNKVELTLTYRGRENAHKDLGMEVMQQVIEDVSDVANCEQPPKALGKLVKSLLSPKSTKGRAKPAAPQPADGEK